LLQVPYRGRGANPQAALSANGLGAVGSGCYSFSNRIEPRHECAAADSDHDDRIGLSVNALRRLGDLLSPHRGRIALAVGLAVLACLLNLPTPLLIQGLVDHAAGDPAVVLPACALGLLAVFAAQAGIGMANGCVIGRVGLRVVRDLRHRLYARLQRVGLSYYDRTPAGAILSRLMDDVSAVQALIT